MMLLELNTPIIETFFKKIRTEIDESSIEIKSQTPATKRDRPIRLPVATLCPFTANPPFLPPHLRCSKLWILPGSCASRRILVDLPIQ